MSNHYRLDRADVRRLLDAASEPMTSVPTTGPRWQTSAGESSPIAPPPGVDLGPFELLRELGRGAMGIVYEARDARLGRRVALKLLGPRLAYANSAVSRERFLREAQAAARLSHPNIAAVHEATGDYIAMQLIDGPNLDGWLSERPRDVRSIVTLLRDAARAVHHAHQQGVVHRDLKPSNLLVSRLATACTVAEECVYVTDFGLAKLDALDSSLSASGDVLGTPGFMAPEQANAGAKVDERTDVYGLGATLYACLSGRPPLVADDLVSALRRIGEEEPPPLRKLCRGQVDEDLQTIVHACLHKEAARRYPTAGSLADDLDHWLDGAAIDARPPRLRHRLGRFLQRRRSTIRVGATVAGLAVLVLGWVVVQAEIARRTERRVGDAAVALTNRVENLLADAEDLFRSGAFQARRLRLERSEAMCREFLAQYDMPRPHHLLARVLRQGERYAEALAELDTALSDAPELIEARFERGLLLAEFVGRSPFHGGPDKSLLPHYRAQAVADLRVVEEPGFTRRYAFRQRDVLFGKAELARLRGDPMKSREFLLAIANDLDPTHLPSILCLANLAFETGNTEEARVWSARSIDLFRGAAPAYRAGGVAMSVPTALESGIPVFNHADVVAGRVPPARVLLRGTVRLQSGDFDGAREDFEWVSGRECEQRARAFEGLGRTHLELGRIHAEQTQTVNAVAEWAAALDAFERAIALDAELGWALLGRGEVRLLQAGHLRAAGFPTEAVRTEGEGRADLRRAAGLGPTAVASQAERLLRPR